MEEREHKGHRCLVDRYDMKKALVDLYYEDNKQKIDFLRECEQDTERNKQKAIENGKTFYSVVGSGISGLKVSLVTGRYFTIKYLNPNFYSGHNVFVTYYRKRDDSEINIYSVDNDRYVIDHMEYIAEDEVKNI